MTGQGFEWAHFLGWPGIALIFGLLGFLLLLSPRIIAERNQYGEFSFFSLPVILFPKAMRQFAARLFGAALVCQALYFGLIWEGAGVHPVQAAETQEETFTPEDVARDWQDRGLYLHKFNKVLRSKIGSYEIGVEDPFVAKIVTETGEPAWRFDLMTPEFRGLKPEAAARKVAGAIKAGTAEKVPSAGQGFFPPSEDAAALLDQARRAWKSGQYRKSVDLAERAWEIRRGYLGAHHPKVLEVERMVASAKEELESLR